MGGGGGDTIWSIADSLCQKKKKKKVIYPNVNSPLKSQSLVIFNHHSKLAIIHPFLPALPEVIMLRCRVSFKERTCEINHFSM